MTATNRIQSTEPTPVAIAGRTTTRETPESVVIQGGKLRRPADTAKLIVGGLAYYLLAKISMLLFSVEPENIALLWLPAGLALYLYSRWGPVSLAAIFAASFLAGFSGLATDSLWQQVLHTGINALGDTLFAFIGGVLLKRRLGGEIREPSQLFDFILYCCLIPLTVSTLIIAGNLWLGDYLPTDIAALTGTAIFVGDFLGVLLIYPLFPAWEKRREDRNRITGLWLGASLFSVGCIAASFYVAHWFLYFALPALIFTVIGTGSLYAHLSLTISVFLFIALSARLHDFATAGGDWLEVLAISTSAAIGILALIIQQRSLLNEKNLRKQWMVTANHDALTGLPNRGHSRFLIQHEMLRLKRNPGTFSLVMLDLDDFKEINDTYGHAAGDRVLVELSRRLLEAFRESDLISRYGGEEFLIMLLGTGQADARDLIDEVRRDIAEHPFDLGEDWIHITFSAGVAEYEPGGDNVLTDLIKLADKRLYQAKRTGRNQVVG